MKTKLRVFWVGLILACCLSTAAFAESQKRYSYVISYYHYGVYVGSQGSDCEYGDWGSEPEYYTDYQYSQSECAPDGIIPSDPWNPWG